MDALRDFEDMLALLHEHEVPYLIIGGLAVTYHARPRYTKGMDLWVDPDPRTSGMPTTHSRSSEVRSFSTLA